MDTTQYPHPWEQDQDITDRLLKLVEDEDWDLFGIADVGPLTDDGYDADRCRQYRDNPENQERASTYTVMKCMRCMTTCDKKRIKELLK